jgi:precorrin-3B C17-methyltransferase
LYLVGIGPGDYQHLTQSALEVLRSVDCIIGYQGYVDLVRRWLPHQSYRASPIGSEQTRVEEATERARAGEKVALIGSGDTGVYGLAGLTLERLARHGETGVQVEVIPGVTAALSAAALLGAPLSNDFAVISLSDLLTPAETIRRRLRACAEADLVTVLYNPASQTRKQLLRDARSIFLEHRAPETPVGLVSRAHRKGQIVELATLATFDSDRAGMLSTLIIGNSATLAWDGRMFTPRGYPAAAPDAFAQTGGESPP